MSFKTIHIFGCHTLTWSVQLPITSAQLFRGPQGFLDEKISMTRKSHITSFYLLCTSLKILDVLLHKILCFPTASQDAHNS